MFKLQSGLMQSRKCLYNSMHDYLMLSNSIKRFDEADRLTLQRGQIGESCTLDM